VNPVLLVAVMLLGSAQADTAYAPGDSAATLAPSEAVKQARRALREARFNMGPGVELDRGSFSISRRQIGFSVRPAAGAPMQSRSTQMAEIDPATIKVTRSSLEHCVAVLGHPGWEACWQGRETDARKFADALFALAQHARDAPRPVDAAAETLDAAAEKLFAEAAARYRTANPKPEFPEAARRLRIQAEVAVRDKRLEDATDLYEEALKLAAWWPEGRFNRALILGELKEYPEAMAEMKKYLMLVPDAPNARAAQDKIYEWEARVK
jgi:hypothetical protein